METPVRNSLPYRKLLALCAVLLFAFTRPAPAQTNAISSYTELVAALNAGVTMITNFQTNTTTTISFVPVSATTIVISNNITIDATSNSVLFLGNGAGAGESFFDVLPNASLTLKNLTLTNGASTNGGAIYNAGTLIISNCTFTENFATNTNGTLGTNGPLGVDSNGGAGGSGGTAIGGAIYSIGPLIISGSIFSNNFVLAGTGTNGGTGGGNAGNGGNGGNGGNAYGGAVFSIGPTNIINQTEFIGNICFAGAGGTGGSFDTNVPPIAGTGGSAGLGGAAAGGAAFFSGPLFMTNCLFFNNIASAGSTGTAEVDFGGGGADGSPGGEALGGGLCIYTNVSFAQVVNTIFFTNSCFGGNGGNTTLNAATGGTGGNAQGGGVWSGAKVTEMSFCTLATNTLTAGFGGTNLDGGISGSAGTRSGYLIFKNSGIFALSSSILSYVATELNATGVADAGYNVVSDLSVTKNTVLNTTKIDSIALVDSALSAVSSNTVGSSLDSFQVQTLQILSGSPAAGFIPGVPGVSFPLTDEALQLRSTPTGAGAFELNPFQSGSVPSLSGVTPATNAVGAGTTATFSVTATGGANFGLQWLLDGTNIINNGHYVGTTSNVLTVKDVSFADEGIYTLVASPTLQVGSNSATGELILTNPPVITQQLAGVIRPIGSVVTLVFGVKAPASFGYQWFFDGAPLAPATNITGLDSNILTINPAFATNAGSYSVIVTNDFGASKTSAVVRLILNPDKTKPTITITSKLSNVRTNNPVMAGTCFDNAQVAYVQYWLTNINTGLVPPTNVTTGFATLTTTNLTNLNTALMQFWSITNPPLPGTNILEVQAADFSSNLSAKLSRKFFYQVSSTNLLITLVSNGGEGTVSGQSFFAKESTPSNGASLFIGEGYVLHAHPTADSLLGTWTNISLTNVTVTNGNTFHFIMESNTTITATFVTNIFLSEGAHGTYNGLFYALPQFVTNVVVTNPVVTNGVTNQVAFTNAVFSNEITFQTAGAIRNLILTKEGTYTGSLLLAGGSYGLNGFFNSLGRVTNIINRTAKAGGPLIVDMNVDTNGAGFISGTVTNAEWTTNSVLSADLAVAKPGSTNFTMLMFSTGLPDTNATVPPGTGYALIADHSGTVTLGGGLADGTVFSETAPSSASNDVPVYVSLYNHTGFLFGWLNLTNLDNTNTSDELMWIKETPAHPSPTALFTDGFTNLLITDGSVWSNLTALTLGPSNSLVISNSDLDLDYTLAVDGNSRLVNAGTTPTNSFNGTLNLKNGFLQITFGDGDGRQTARGFGAMLQSTTNAAGYFVIKTDAGSILLNGGDSTNSLP
jgi:hypothetical protein